MSKQKFKKINLVPSSVLLGKKLVLGQYVALIILALTFVALIALGISNETKIATVEGNIDDANKIIAEADFTTLERLKAQYQEITTAMSSGDFASIPPLDKTTTQVLQTVNKNIPDGTSIKNVNGQLKQTGEYAYSFDFVTANRERIPTFLKALQNESLLKNVNVSTIVSADGGWSYSIVIKTGGVLDGE